MRGRDEGKARVRTAKGRRIASTRWLTRHLNDPYVQRAQKEGYRSRAAYKLLEIDLAEEAMFDIMLTAGDGCRVAEVPADAVHPGPAAGRSASVGEGPDACAPA